jgi:hypothetical protein
MIWLLVFVILEGAASAFKFYSDLLLGQVVPEFTMPSKYVLAIFVVVFATWRAWAFHPAVSADYGRWLASTPWDARKPLPLGPVHLEMSDILIIAFMLLVSWPACGEYTFHMPALFLAVYSAALGLPFLATDQVWGAYAVGFGVGLVAYVWRNLPLALTASVITYAAAFVALRRSLARFPWNVKWLERFGPFGSAANQRSQQTKSVGWPFGSLGPKWSDSNVSVPLLHAVSIGLLFGWWFYVAASLVPPGSDRSNACDGILILATVFGALIRVLTYIAGYGPPISLAGRIFTGSWIIRGYDQVFATPLLACFIAFSFRVAAKLAGIDPTVYCPILLALVIMILFGMGPSLKEWRLTGNHRITVGAHGLNSVKVG